MNGKPYTVISLFAGCGGSSLGYKQAGFKELLAIDFDRHAVETFKLNFNIPIWEKDITKILSQDVLNFCKIKSGDLDILDGSPPCQGFSSSGKRRINDLRNNLFLDFVRFIRELQPKVFVMENVSGQIKGKMKGFFKEILSELKLLNYIVKVKLMNSKYYGVPQSRERLIYLGVRNDLHIEPNYPIPNKKVVTVKEALLGLSNIGEKITPTGKVALLFNEIRPGEGMDIIYNKKYRKASYFNVRKLSFLKPSFTVTKSFSSSAAGLLHPKDFRFMTIAEIKRLCSFPDDFKIQGNFVSQWARLGNAVMPKFMQAIAQNISDNILDRYYLNSMPKNTH